MSSDLSVTRAGAASATAEVARPSGAVPADRRAADPAQVPPAPVGKSLPNPTLRLDPGLAIVVIEFRDKTGTVRSTIPTEQQLDAYRSWDRGHIGEPPRGGREAANGGAARGATATAEGSAAATALPAAAPHRAPHRQASSQGGGPPASTGTGNKTG